MRQILVLCSLLLFTISCRNDGISSPEKKELKSEKKLLEEIISPDFITRVDDKLIIASSLSDTMLYVYSLPDLKYLHSTGKKGRGPDEIPLFPMFCESLNHALYVWGYGPRTIIKFDINSKTIISFLWVNIFTTPKSFFHLCFNIFELRCKVFVILLWIE